MIVKSLGSVPGGCAWCLPGDTHKASRSQPVRIRLLDAGSLQCPHVTELAPAEVSEAVSEFLGLLPLLLPCVVITGEGRGGRRGASMADRSSSLAGLRCDGEGLGLQ